MKKQKFQVRNEQDYKKLLNQNYQSIQQIHINTDMSRQENGITAMKPKFSFAQMLESIVDILEDINYGNSIYETSESFQRLWNQSLLLYNWIIERQKPKENIKQPIGFKHDLGKKYTLYIMKRLKKQAERKLRKNQLVQNLNTSLDLYKHSRISRSQLEQFHHTISSARDDKQLDLFHNRLALHMIRGQSTSKSNLLDHIELTPSTALSTIRNKQIQIENQVLDHVLQNTTESPDYCERLRTYVHKQNQRLFHSTISHLLS